jgi:hypothetical protein
MGDGRRSLRTVRVARSNIRAPDKRAVVRGFRCGSQWFAASHKQIGGIAQDRRHVQRDGAECISNSRIWRCDARARYSDLMDRGKRSRDQRAGKTACLPKLQCRQPRRRGFPIQFRLQIPDLARR